MQRLKDIFVVDIYNEIRYSKMLLEPLCSSSSYDPMIKDLILSLMSDILTAQNNTPMYCANHLSEFGTETLCVQLKDMLICKLSPYVDWTNRLTTVEISTGTNVFVKQYHEVAESKAPMELLKEELQKSLDNGDYIPERLRSLLT